MELFQPYGKIRRKLTGKRQHAIKDFAIFRSFIDFEYKFVGLQLSSRIPAIVHFTILGVVGWCDGAG